MPAGIPAAVRPLTVQFSYNDPATLESLFDAYPGQIAAVVLEPETRRAARPGLFRRAAPAL